MANAVGIVSRRDISIHTRSGNYPSKNKLVLYKPSFLRCKNHFKQLQLSNKAERFSFEDECG